MMAKPHSKLRRSAAVLIDSDWFVECRQMPDVGSRREPSALDGQLVRLREQLSAQFPKHQSRQLDGFRNGVGELRARLYRLSP